LSSPLVPTSVFKKISGRRRSRFAPRGSYLAYILNETIERDWEGEYTYVGVRGNSVIDYVAVNEGIRDRIRSFRIGEKVDSESLTVENKNRNH